MTRHLRIAIIGAGFGGLGMAVSLRRAGCSDVTIFEKGDDVGGVWRENTYPGAACDVPSHLYSFSFHRKADWTRRFAPQQEILDYLRDVADTYDLRRRIRFRTEVTAASYDDRAATWTLQLADGTTHTADVLVTACGQLSRPAYPDIPGQASFAGELFHSAEWDHGYDLTGRRVAVVGTGASAIQFVPEIAKRVAHLSLFQRQPAYVIRKPDYPYSARAERLFARVPAVQRVSRWRTYWGHEPRILAFVHLQPLMRLMRLRFTRHLHAAVTDPRLRDALTPRYPMGCKRILISNDYYPALVRENVDVVTDRIAEINRAGVRTVDGRQHDVDAIILGTGFTATEFLAPMRITGRDGRDLAEVWGDGAEAYLGVTVHGFPNLFLLYGPNTNLGHNSIIFMLEAQIRFAQQLVDRLRAGAASVEVTAAAQRVFNDELQRRSRRTVWERGCTSWYKTASGRNTVNWPSSTLSFWWRTRAVDWDAFAVRTGEPERDPALAGAE